MVGFECSFTFAPYRGAGDLLSLLRQSVNLHSSSARQLLRPKSMATALQMLARYPTLLCFAPCIHAFMPQNLFTRIMNTGSKQKKGDPDVQVWLRQTSLTPHPFFGACELATLRVSSDKRTLFPEKRMLRSAERRGEAVVLNVADGLGSLKANPSSKKNRLAEYQAVLFFQAAFGVWMAAGVFGFTR